MPKARVQFVKQYSNHTGRQFMRFRDSKTGRSVEILTRGPNVVNSRGQSSTQVPLWTRAEARKKAERQLGVNAGR